jgi:two-component system OmpR family response regulator
MVKPRALVVSHFPAPVYFNVASLLSGAGYRVDMAIDVTAGLAWLRRHYYDIVIDVENPRTPSWQSCEWMRQLTEAPIIVISPRADAEACVRTINAGADYFLRKSCGPLELLARIRALRQRARCPHSTPAPLAAA